MLTNTLLHQEIHEQPDAVARLLERERANVAALAKAIRARDVCHVVIAARGTSDNAGRYAKYVLGAFNGLPVSLATPSLHTIYEQPPRFRRALVLGISQSGQSPDIVAVVEEARRQGQLTAVLTNSPHSPMAQQGDFVIDLHAESEKAVAATKSYTTSLAAVALLSTSLAVGAGERGAGEREARLHELLGVPEALAATLGADAAVGEVAPRYRYMERCVAIGRGFNYATAFELALKLKELTYTTVEAYSSADFLHGPLALIERGFPAIVIAPAGRMTTRLHEFMRTLRDRGAEVIAISDEPATLDLARIALPLAQSVPEWLSPITAIVPGQLLALHLAHVRDLNVDQPRAIRKVTETE